MTETRSEYNERRAMVEEQLRESLDYSCELAEEVKQELQIGFDEFRRTAEYRRKKQEAKPQSTMDECEFDNHYDKKQWDDYLENNHGDVEERLRAPHEEAFQQEVEKTMV